MRGLRTNAIRICLFAPHCLASTDWNRDQDQAGAGEYVIQDEHMKEKQKREKRESGKGGSEKRTLAVADERAGV
jgi:hypothetical protein